MMNFRIFRTETKKPKTYIVTDIDADYGEVIDYAKRYFKCSAKHIEFEPAWLYDGYLYPDADLSGKKGAKKVGMAYWAS